MATAHLLAPWFLTALILLWLAQQRPAAYARAAVALLLSGAAGLACTWSVPLAHLPAHESSLFREYLTMPGALTGWYLLLALELVTAISSIRARIAVMVMALCAVTTSVLRAAHPGSAGVLGAVVPLLTWFIAGHFPRKDTRRGVPSDAWAPQGKAIELRPRLESPDTWWPPTRCRWSGQTDGHAPQRCARGSRMVDLRRRVRRVPSSGCWCLVRPPYSSPPRSQTEAN
ncbi:hypothetical protein ACFWOT_29980 [Streptomyces sp. NPDC058440]|uniref:hypothetical protein n=1 Tax=Streptomyces sp. NPDC058440 TaxID=3346501 RepID=UPI0036540A67